jgi:hypothetical protein
MKKRTLGFSVAISGLAMVSLFSVLPGGLYPSEAKSKEEKQAEVDLRAMHLNCLRCKTEMEFGMTMSQTNSASNYQILWSPGIRGLSPFARTPPQKDVCTFRCPNCGYLESYAK